ncbi:MAG: tetratricopeptide repeat protein [Gemmatales bacterium]
MAALRMVDGLWSRCMTLVKSGQFAAAKSMIQRLLQLEIPASMRSEASMMLADMLRMQGEYQLARRHVCAAIAGNPEDAALHHMLGYLHDEDDEGSEISALKHLKHAVKLAPDSAECHRALGEYLVQHGQSKKGMHHLEEARSLEPDNLDVLRTYIVTQVELGKEKEARQCLREVQFRLGKAHTSVQTLWNDLAYAMTLKQQEVRKPVATLPLLKPVSERSKATSSESMPRILRFDAAHPLHARKSRLAPRPKK